MKNPTKMCRKDSLRLIFVVITLTEILTVVNGLNVTYDPPRIEKLYVDDEVNVTVTLGLRDRELVLENHSVKLQTEPASVLDASFISDSWNCQNFACNRTFKVTGLFLGFGEVFLLMNDSSSKNGSSNWERVLPPLEVTVLRQEKLINHLFTIFVATVVTINYINFGCALETEVVKEVLKRPVGPVVGLLCQFIVMPLVSYGVGYWLFTDPVLRLGLFTFGCSPGGGASNMWTVLLGGNLNLSITMTFLSTVAAFGTLPMWLFTLGRTILKDTKIVVPYSNIITSLVCLIIPIGVGLAIQRFFPKVAARSKKLLAPICIILLIGIIVMACIANTYIFFMLSWQMVVAASLSVWSGFLAGVLVAMVFRFPYGDIVAISVETGIQNSGIAFILLSYSLVQPVSDMAAVVPVAGSMITPIPLFLILCGKKVRNRWFRSDTIELQGLHSKKDEYHSTKCILDEMKEQDCELKEAKSD